MTTIQDITGAILALHGALEEPHGGAEVNEGVVIDSGLSLLQTALVDLHRIADALEAIANYGPLSSQPGSDLSELAKRLAAVEDRIAGTTGL